MKSKNESESKAAQLLTATEAAAILRLRVQTLALWRCSGRNSLPYVKSGSRILYRRADIENWLASRTATSTAQMSAAGIA